MPESEPSDRLDVRSEAVEAVVVEALRACVGDGVACAVLDASSPLAHFGRAVEAAAFPGFDMAAAMAPFEEASLFIYTVDLDAGRIGHIGRLVRGADAATIEATGRTLIEVLDDRVVATEPEERATVQEILDHHGISAAAQVWNMATSAVTDRIPPTRHRPYSLLTFKGLHRLTEPIGITHFFAYVNHRSMKAIRRVGIPCSLAGGREFHLAIADSYDHDFVGVHLEFDPATVRVLEVPDESFPLSRVLAETDVPVVVIVDDEHQVIDLTEAVSSPHVHLAEVGRARIPPLDDAEVVIDLTADGAHGEVVLDLTDPVPDGLVVERSDPEGEIPAPRER